MDYNELVSLAENGDVKAMQALGQFHSDFGGNKENVDELISSFPDLNIVTVNFDQRLGVARARNEGLKISKGKYVYFIDADDYLYDGALEKLVQVAKDTDYDLINGERIGTPYIRERSDELL